jgi:hypothetical protein
LERTSYKKLLALGRVMVKPSNPKPPTLMPRKVMVKPSPFRYIGKNSVYKVISLSIFIKFKSDLLERLSLNGVELTYLAEVPK